jgi:hypothetical protein
LGEVVTHGQAGLAATDHEHIQHWIDDHQLSFSFVVRSGPRIPPPTMTH